MSEEEFNLSDFLTDTLSLEANVSAPQRAMFPFKAEDVSVKLLQLDPLEVLGEKSFYTPREMSEDVVGTPIQEYFRGLNVLITGGTGFIGKILIDKLIRSIPQLGHVYLLIRPKRGKSSKERFEQLLEDRVFLRMKTEVPHYHTKISVVDGDTLESGLGLSEPARQMLLDKVNVVFHSAADVRFTEPLRSALRSNLLGGLHVLELAKKISNLKSYVHVSTAFSQCVRRVIEERVPKMNVNYKEVLNYVETMGDQELERETPRIISGWPNTYTFSKAVCEDMIQEEAEGLPVCIFRPSVVWSTYNEPVKGWTDNINGPLGVLLGIGIGVIHTMRMNVELTMDTVPVDYVVNSMVAAAWATGTTRKPTGLPVYNFVSTPVKPMKWKTIQDCGVKYQDVFPFENAIWHHFVINTQNYWTSEIAHFFLHKIPGLLVDKLAALVGQKPRLSRIFDKLDQMKDQINYFMFSIWEFKNDNVMNLWQLMSDKDKKLFNFDLTDVDIHEHFLLGKLGIRYYFLKEKMESIPKAMQRKKLLYWVHNSFTLVSGLAVLKLMVLLARALPL